MNGTPEFDTQAVKDYLVEAEEALQVAGHLVEKSDLWREATINYVVLDGSGVASASQTRS